MRYKCKFITSKVYGTIAVIIDKDFEATYDLYSWHLLKVKYTNDFYIQADIKDKKVYLHRMVANAKKGEIIDHENGNRTDNRRSNLRITNNSNNGANSKPNTSSATKYKGVWIDKRRKKPYIAEIKINYKKIYLGGYDTPEGAALAYNKAAIKYFGEFALLNII